MKHHAVISPLTGQTVFTPQYLGNKWSCGDPTHNHTKKRDAIRCRFLKTKRLIAQHKPKVLVVR